MTHKPNDPQIDIDNYNAEIAQYLKTLRLSDKKRRDYIEKLELINQNKSAHLRAKMLNNFATDLDILKGEQLFLVSGIWFSLIYLIPALIYLISAILPDSLLSQIVSVFSFENFSRAFSYNPLLMTTAGILIALGLFYMRGYHPKSYGTLEINVGLVTLINSAVAVSEGNIPSLLQYLAGIYVIIRGLDNVAKTLEPGTRTHTIFSKLFNNPR